MRLKGTKVYWVDDISAGSAGEGYHSRFADIAAAILSLDCGWSVAQVTTYNTNAALVILEHTSGAQFVMQASTAYPSLDTANVGPDGVGNPASMRFAWGSSGLSTQIPTCGPSYNPLTPTFCSDSNLFLFSVTDINSAGTNINQDGQQYWIADEDSAYLAWCSVTGNGNVWRDYYQIIDETSDPWQALNAGNVGGPLMIRYRNQSDGPRYPGFWILPDGSTMDYGVIQGTYGEYGENSRRTGDWTRRMVIGESPEDYIDWVQNPDDYPEPLALWEMSSGTYGRKGLLRPRFACHAREDLGFSMRLREQGVTGYDLIKWTYDGNVHPWPQDFQLPY